MKVSSWNIPIPLILARYLSGSAETGISGQPYFLRIRTNDLPGARKGRTVYGGPGYLLTTVRVTVRITGFTQDHYKPPLDKMTAQQFFTLWFI
jgi:hypothetical protein